MTQPFIPLAPKQIGVGLLLTLFGSASLYFGIGAWSWNSRFYTWLDARPMELTVDLSVPATYTVPFRQTCQMAHGQSIFIELDTTSATDESVRDWFAGLKGTLTIRNLQGEPVLSRDFHSQHLRLWEDSPRLVGFYPFATGDYLAEFNIEQGASATQGVPHQLYARYDLCGLELFPAYMLGGLSIVTGLIACGIAWCRLPAGSRKDQRCGVSRPRENAE